MVNPKTVQPAEFKSWTLTKANLIPPAQVLQSPAAPQRPQLLLADFNKFKSTQATTGKRDSLLLCGEHLHWYFSWGSRMSFVKQQRLSCTMHSTYIFGCACSARKHSREQYLIWFWVTFTNTLRGGGGLPSAVTPLNLQSPGRLGYLLGQYALSLRYCYIPQHIPVVFPCIVI